MDGPRSVAAVAVRPSGIPARRWVSLRCEDPLQYERTFSVASRAIARIKDALLRKDLRPGDYLPSETELTKTLGIGKSSVREAVKMLQAMGGVEVRRGQGRV